MKSRTQNSMRNLVVAYAMQALSIIASFACRTVFARLLEEEYLGIGGLFTNIISILALSELGIANVIIVHLYEPIAKNDRSRICKLMNFYRRAYNIIGVFVLVCGVAITPFLEHLVKTDKQIPHLKTYFLLFVVQSAASYFFAYKRSLLIASQNEYVCSLVTQAFDLVTKFGQILVLWITHQYLLYLIVSIITGLASNIVVSIITNKKYPYITKCSDKLSRIEIKSMLRDVSSMMLHKVGGTVVSSTDNLLISALIGIVYTGRYSNYVLMMNVIMQIINILLSSISASLGDFNAQKSFEDRKRMFNSLCFLTQWVFGFGMIGFICLFQPTISLWLGKKYLLDFSIVIIISLNFYLNGIFRIPSTFVDLNQLYNKTKWKPIAVAVINLVVSIVCAKYMGLIGIFVGTLVSYLIVSIWVDPFYLYKYIWKTGLFKYFANQIVSLLITVLICIATYFAISLVPFYPIKVLICFILPNLCFFAIYHRRKEFRFIFDRFLKK